MAEIFYPADWFTNPTKWTPQAKFNWLQENSPYGTLGQTPASQMAQPAAATPTPTPQVTPPPSQLPSQLISGVQGGASTFFSAKSSLASNKIQAATALAGQNSIDNSNQVAAITKGEESVAKLNTSTQSLDTANDALAKAYAEQQAVYNNPAANVGQAYTAAATKYTDTVNANLDTATRTLLRDQATETQASAQFTSMVNANKAAIAKGADLPFSDADLSGKAAEIHTADTIILKDADNIQGLQGSLTDQGKINTFIANDHDYVQATNLNTTAETNVANAKTAAETAQTNYDGQLEETQNTVDGAYSLDIKNPVLAQRQQTMQDSFTNSRNPKPAPTDPNSEDSTASAAPGDTSGSSASRSMDGSGSSGATNDSGSGTAGTPTATKPTTYATSSGNLEGWGGAAAFGGGEFGLWKSIQSGNIGGAIGSGAAVIGGVWSMSDALFKGSATGIWGDFAQGSFGSTIMKIPGIRNIMQFVYFHPLIAGAIAVAIIVALALLLKKKPTPAEQAIAAYDNLTVFSTGKVLALASTAAFLTMGYNITKPVGSLTDAGIAIPTTSLKTALGSNLTNADGSAYSGDVPYGAPIVLKGQGSNGGDEVVVLTQGGVVNGKSMDNMKTYDLGARSFAKSTDPTGAYISLYTSNGQINPNAVVAAGGQTAILTATSASGSAATQSAVGVAGSLDKTGITTGQ